MKKNLFYLLVFVVLLSVAGYLLSENQKRSTLEGQENYAFSFPDTAAIDKIVIESKKPSEATLIRTKDGWRLNGDSPVRRDAMQTLLETLYRMEMRNFLPERMQSTVIRNLSVLGKKVKIYQRDKLYKTLYVGNQTQDELGTYMMIEGADAPYAVHIPGFNGFLNTRFIDDPELWRRRDLVRIDPRNIKEVRMIYPDSLEASFRLRVFSPDSLYFVRSSDNEVITDFNPTRARLFLAAFKNLRYEGAIVPSDAIYARRDSLLASTPLFRLEVKDIDGKVTTVSGYRIKGESQTIDPDDPRTFFDPDRLHGFINDQRMVLLQYYGLRNVLKPLGYFRMENN